MIGKDAGVLVPHLDIYTELWERSQIGTVIMTREARSGKRRNDIITYSMTIAVTGFHSTEKICV